MNTFRIHTAAQVGKPSLRSLLIASCMTALCAVPLSLSGADAEPAPDKVFELGEIVVQGTNLTAVSTLENTVDAEKIQKLNAGNIAEALRALPGVTMAEMGARNEQIVYVRGFDARRVPIYVDGVPTSVPYDGYGDLGRYTTADISSITLYKGYSSVLAGPNAMGGIINVVSRKPVAPLELTTEVGAYSGNGRLGSINVGSKQGTWYTQVGASYSESDYFRLPDDFAATKAEDGGRRENSYARDWKVSGKVGYTPNDTDEYAVGFVHQEADKGNPPYAGTLTSSSIRYWQWPEWDKTTVYYASMTQFGDSYIHPRIYFDRFDNTLDAFDDATYSTMAKKSSFESIYNDYSYGASVEGGTNEWEAMTLKAALHFNTDHHDQHNVGYANYLYEDRVWSSGLEATTNCLGKWQLQGGLGYDWMTNDEAVDTNTGLPIASSDYNSFNPAAVLFYNLNASNALHVSVAHKSRFPTLKDRFSYKMGSAIPNPDLKPETATHYELGYTGRPLDKLTVSADVFMSRIDDTIESVANVETTSSGTWVSQNQNVGRSKSSGFEAALDYTLSTQLSIGANYTCMTRENTSSPALKSTDTPHNSGTVYADYRPLAWLELVPYADLSGWRYSDTAGTKVDGFVVANFKTVVTLPYGFSLEVGVKNIADCIYEYTDGYPEAGRSYFANVRYTY
jgi:iron complex outermembrane recepter protein